MKRRAVHELPEVMPSDRMMGGDDYNHGEGIHEATVMTHRVFAEVLAENFERDELFEGHALRIGRQSLRGNRAALP